MVRSAKRITRKDLRRPDPFVTYTTESLRLFNEHKTLLFLSVGLLLAILLGVWGWQTYTRSQNLLAAEKFSDALALYRKGQYEEAVRSLDQVKTYRLSHYAHLSLFYQANSYLQLKDYDRAVTVLDEFLKETRDPFLRQVGFLTLGYAQENAGRCEEAVNAFSQAREIAGPRQEEALLAEARCQVETGKLQAALSSYREHLSDYPNSEKKTATLLRIQELEARVGATGGGK